MEQNSNNKLKKTEYIRFLIKANRLIWENDKNCLIKYSDNQTFFFPKAMVWKQEVDTKGDYLFVNLPFSANASYLQLSFAKEPVAYTDKDGKQQLLDHVEIKTKVDGELDKDGKQVYKATKLSLWDLRKHFATESKEIIEQAKKIKNKSESSHHNNSQIQTLH